MGVNPYWRALKAELMDLDVEFDGSPSWSFSRRWAWAHRRDVQIVHFHAVQRFWACELTQARLRWVVRFARNLLFARTAGYRTLYTVHDLRPLEHSLQPDWIDFLGHWLAVNLTDAVFAHYDSGAKLLAKEYGRKRGVHVVKHPGYVGVYPNDISEDEARSELGFSSRHTVFLFFGGIRPNKGIDALISTFRELPGDDLRLLVVGQPWPPKTYLDGLLDQARQDPRVRVMPGLVPDDQVQLYLNAADVVVFPFKQILTSGSTLLAMSFARPVVAPALGCLADVITPATGILYDSLEPDALRKALLASGALDLHAMGKCGFDQAAAFSFRDLASETLRLYTSG